MKLPGSVRFHNIEDFMEHSVTGDAFISRIPGSLREQLNANARHRSLNTSGCEIRFRLTGPTVRFRLRACEVLSTHYGPSQAQVLFGDFSHTYFHVDEAVAEIEIAVPDYDGLMKAHGERSLFHPRLVRLLLPPHTTISELAIEGDVAPPEPGDVPAKRVLNYGSSITQGVGVATSRETWAARCAHALGFDCINLGFGSGCHCEPAMTDYLCQRDDFDCAILETGINMLQFDPSVADERIEALIRRLSAAHPDKPIFCLGVFPCRDDIASNWSGRAAAIRKLVRETVERVGAPNLHFIEGGKALDHRTDLTADLVHPSPIGMTGLGTSVAGAIRRILGPGPARQSDRSAGRDGDSAPKSPA